MASIGDTIEAKPARGTALGGRFAAFGALGVRIGAAGLAYLLQIVLARSLGAAEYGTFSFAWSLVTMGGFLATLGYAQVAVRFLAQYQQTGDMAHAHGFIRQALLMTALGSALAIGGLLLIFPAIEWGWGSLCCAALTIGLMALPFFALTDVLEGFARSQGWTIRALAPPYLLRSGGLMLMLLIAVGAGMKIDAILAMKFALLATALACLAAGWLIVRPLLAALPAAQPAYAGRIWLANARPTFLADLALLARQNIDLVVLGLVAPAATVGIYFAATRIASLLGLIEFALGAAFGHRFARAQQSGTLHEVWREAWRLSAGLGLVSAIGLMALAPFILSLFGPDFVAATLAVEILLIAATIKLLIGPMEDLLSMNGHASDVWRANAFGAAAMLIGCLIFAPLLHATGAAIGSAIGALTAAYFLTQASKERLGLSPFSALGRR
jgi:O-antigen/teichoic acid export membrane protein